MLGSDTRCKKKTFIFLISFLSLAVGCLAQIGAANSSSTLTAWQGKSEAAVRLIAGSREDDYPDQFWLGVQIKLDPGWKTYWRYPGETGAAPRFKWEGSESLATAKVHWPAPKRFSAFGYDGIGYTKEVVIPVSLTPIIKHQPITAHLKLDYMICAKVRGEAGLQVLRLLGRTEATFRAPDLIIEGPNPFAFGRRKIALSNDQKSVIMDLPVYTGTSKTKLTDQVLTLTMIDGKHALQQRLKVGR